MPLAQWSTVRSDWRDVPNDPRMIITIGALAWGLLKRRKMVKPPPTNWGIEREKPRI